MKLYLSSYKLGNETETLKKWLALTNKRVGYVPNAFDFTSMPPENRIKHMDFVYGGYSAGCCVLSTTLKGLQTVDEPYGYPYEGLKETIWEGLGVIDYMFLPHYDSDHPESEKIAEEVVYCQENELHYKTVRDGEVVLVEKCSG